MNCQYLPTNNGDRKHGHLENEEYTMEYAETLSVSVGRAQEIVGLGRTFLYEEIASGRLKAKKAGRRTLILIADLKVWLDSLTVFSGHDR